MGHSGQNIRFAQRIRNPGGRQARTAMVTTLLCCLGGLALASPVAAARSKHKHKPRSLTYKVVFHIEHGEYGSQIENDGVTGNEIDNFQATASYGGIKLPRSDRAPSIKRVPSKPETFDPDGMGAAWQTIASGGASSDCRAGLESDIDLPPVLTAPGGRRLSLHVEMARAVLLKNVTGKINGTTPCTNLYADGSFAFNPAQRQPHNYMPGMLTAKLDPIPLDGRKGLRAMKVDQTKTITVTAQQNALRPLPPSDCSTPFASCSQHFGWKGTVEITRTG